MLVCVFFFFKQKTAYEMRISDWSSDVCSSDLFEERLEADDVHRMLGRHRTRIDEFARRGVTGRRRCGGDHSRQRDQRRADFVVHAVSSPGETVLDRKSVV